MLGQPASSQTVCSPSRRTSDFSSVYSGPVRSRVLIQSGLRSIGTWLLRTSRRRSLRPDGSIPDPADGVDSAVSLMISTVLRAGIRPPGRTKAPPRRGGASVRQGCRSDGLLGLALRATGDLVDTGVDGVGPGTAGGGARGVLVGVLVAGGGHLLGLHAQIG